MPSRPRIGIKPPKTAGQAWWQAESQAGQPGATVQRVEVDEQLEQAWLGLFVVDHDRRAGPGVAQVARIGLA